MRNFNEVSHEGQEQIKSILIEELDHNFLPEELITDRMDINDLHHKLFNEDYFIIGYYEANKWLEANIGVFTAIGAIQEYESENFGEVNTKLDNSESVVNMFVYILGEELIYDLDIDLTVAELLTELKS